MGSKVIRGIVMLGILSIPIVLFAVTSDAPEINNIQIREVGDDSATITWETSIEADSMVNYGLSNNYGIERDPLNDKKAHGVVLTKLEKNTTYHFRVVSSDERGNQSVSGDFTFTTTGYEDIPEIKKVKEEKQQAIVGKVLDLLSKVTDKEALAIINGQVQEVAKKVDEPPHVMGFPRVDNITMDSAEVSWTTDRESNSIVSIATDDAYTANSGYTSDQGLVDDAVTNHRVTIVGLEPATLYHVSASSEGSLGLKGVSDDVTFRTKSDMPVIQGIEVIKTEETSATISWSTNFPASGVVEYTNMTTGEIRSQGSPEFIVGHTVRLTDLTFGTRYSAVVRVDNKNGDTVSGDPFTFVTTKDTAPPIISKVTNESTLYPGGETRIQTVVGWSTDEQAKCSFHYVQGLGAPGDKSFTVDALSEYKTEHVQVVLEFLPATVYKFWIECSDHAGNSSRSEDFVLFTPAKEKSIIDIIMENFQGSFGWIKNIGK